MSVHRVPVYVSGDVAFGYKASGVWCFERVTKQRGSGYKLDDVFIVLLDSFLRRSSGPTDVLADVVGQD